MQGNKVMLLIAVVAGVLATGLAFAYLHTVTGSIEEQQAEPTMQVLVVAADLPANHTINPETDLRTERVPARTFQSLVRSAVKADELESVRGRQIHNPIPAGTPLFYSHLVGVYDLDIPAGMRAMSIQVSGANAMGGILVPGDRVDLIVSYPMPRESGGGAGTPAMDPTDPGAAFGAIFGEVMAQQTAPQRWMADEVLSNIRILAVGQRLSMSRQQLLFGMETGIGGGAGAVIITVEVTREQALDLIRSTGGGSNPVTLLLRPPQSVRGAQ